MGKKKKAIEVKEAKMGKSLLLNIIRDLFILVVVKLLSHFSHVRLCATP